MKAISIKQPWASLIAEGFKTIETRVWNTDYRGDILICASKGIDKVAMKRLSKLPEFQAVDDMTGFPTGVALCVAKVVDCRKMTKDDIPKALCNVYPRAMSIELTNIRKINPFPVKGKLKLFEVFSGELLYLPNNF